MNLLKVHRVAFAVSIAELTMFAMQTQEETPALKFIGCDVALCGFAA
jgi:hypothetical protein